MINIDLDNKEIRFTIGTMMHQRLGSDWAWDHTQQNWKMGPALLIWLVRGGAADLWVDGTLFKAERGSFFLMPASGHTYCGRHNPDNPFEVSWMFVSFTGKEGIILPVSGICGIPFHCHLSDLDFLTRIMDRILETSGNGQIAWLHSLLDEVRHQVHMQELSEIDLNIRSLANQIQRDPSKFKSLEDMLESFPISKDHLIRLFRRYMGMTPGEYLIRTRIDHAKGLLLITSDSMKEIAYHLGYSDQFVFSRQFKTRTGVSPREFRRGAGAAGI